ncbi:DUF1329 domain-containing protein [Pseudomonas sp. GV071]|jgi:hypothetical protein|uniref:DUF1329 domain-containing protein n=1 Tax=Pseudomonas sp. GV071 TaxID=2135754 RepID=UPI000D37F5E8|nr:DUF1329 domain-containing protein [Pseudomonas sp. GV071]PTQ74344.1 uncharacterized protein DUF1329 [Pseudomonas sp. GV071]
MLTKQAVLCTLAAFGFVALSAHAAVPSSEIAKLGTTLTPLGGEKAGNAAGTIPPWEGGITSAPEGYKGSGQHHIDPFPNDKPLFVIDKSNVQQYKANLTVGQIAMINSYPTTFKIPVYTSRRTGSAPDWVYRNTAANAATAKLVESGNGFEDAYAGIPFPIPQNGLEAVWNHIARYRGEYIVRTSSGALVQKNGSYALLKTKQEVKFKFYDRKSAYKDLNNIMFFFSTETVSPARFAGEAAIVHETLNQMTEPRKAWGYTPGQRRVRRAPTLSYDTATSGSDGIETVDSVDMYNGSPDRYDWKLLGKKEIYVPYNNYALTAQGVRYDDLLKPGHINPDLTRYELHRVWVVEATLKPTNRHIYGKRTLYLDEDSWQAVEIDNYDGKGELWNIAVAYTKNFYDLPAVWSGIEAYYDIQSRRYYVTNLDSEEVETANISKPVPEDGYFDASSLRRKGVR